MGLSVLILLIIHADILEVLHKVPRVIALVNQPFPVQVPGQVLTTEVEVGLEEIPTEAGQNLSFLNIGGCLL